MKRIIIVLIATWLLAPAASAKTDLTRLNRLNGVSVYSDDKEARIVVRFAKNWNRDIRPVFFEKSIQIDLEGVYINPAKRQFPLNQPPLVSAAAYQFSPTTVRLRLFMSDDPRTYAERWSAETNGELLIVSVRKLPETAPEPVEETTLPPVPVHPAEPAHPAVEAPPVYAADEPPRLPEALLTVPPEPSPDAAVTQPGAADAPASKGFLKYENPTAPEPPSMSAMVIKMIASLSFVTALVLILGWGAKHYLGRFNVIPGRNETVRVLARGSLGVKQQVSIVDVAGEILVLGVTEENVSLLATVCDEETIDRLRRSTHGVFPSAKARAAAPNASAGASGVPALFNAALKALRIGRVKGSSKSLRAVFDESDPETFAGQMNLAAPGPAGEAEAKLNRDDLMLQVTNAIRERNGRLTIA